MSFAELLGLKSRKGPSPFRLSFTDEILFSNKRYNNRLTYEDLLNAESEIGKTLFGPIPAGHQREFFKTKGNTWIWHEGWADAAGVFQNLTISYDVRPDGVYKKVPGVAYQKIEGNELNNFIAAVRAYHSLVKSRLYC